MDTIRSKGIPSSAHLWLLIHLWATVPRHDSAPQTSSTSLRLARQPG